MVVTRIRVTVANIVSLVLHCFNSLCDLRSSLGFCNIFLLGFIYIYIYFLLGSNFYMHFFILTYFQTFVFYHRRWIQIDRKR